LSTHKGIGLTVSVFQDGTFSRTNANISSGTQEFRGLYTRNVGDMTAMAVHDAINPANGGVNTVTYDRKYPADPKLTSSSATQGHSCNYVGYSSRTYGLCDNNFLLSRNYHGNIEDQQFFNGSTINGIAAVNVKAIDYILLYSQDQLQLIKFNATFEILKAINLNGIGGIFINAEFQNIYISHQGGISIYLLQDDDLIFFGNIALNISKDHILSNPLLINETLYVGANSGLFVLSRCNIINPANTIFK
jgi:hypothetical protein